MLALGRHRHKGHLASVAESAGVTPQLMEAHETRPEGSAHWQMRDE